MIDDDKILDILKAKLLCVFSCDMDEEQLLYLKYNITEELFKKHILQIYNLNISIAVDGLGIIFPIENIQKIINIIERNLKIEKIIN